MLEEKRELDAQLIHESKGLVVELVGDDEVAVVVVAHEVCLFSGGFLLLLTQL